MRDSDQQNKHLQSRVSELESEVGRLQRHVTEREILLEDVHHRVKNHLFLLIGLVNLERGRLEDQLSEPGPAIRALDNIVDRIHVVSSIYTHLYQAEPSTHAVPAGAFIDRLTSLVSASQSERQIHLMTDVGDLVLPIQTALPVGLIVNEALSNSYKHAFPDGRRGSISIELHGKPQRRALLVLTDDGVGRRPPADPTTTGGVGTLIIDTLVEQIGGTLRNGSGPGTSIEVDFPLQAER